MAGAGSDDEAVLSAVRGEHWALERLFTAYWPVLVGYYRAVGWGDVAEDLAMNVWSSLLAGGLKRVRGGSEQDFRVLLFTVAHRRLVDYQRYRSRRPSVPSPVEAMDTPAISGLGADPAVLVGERLDADDALRYLREVLSPAQAEVVHLRVVVGFTVRKVATIVSRSPNAVSMLYARALRRLGDALAVQEAGDS